MMPFLASNVVLNDLESLPNRTVIIEGNPEMISHLIQTSLFLYFISKGGEHKGDGFGAPAQRCGGG